MTPPPATPKKRRLRHNLGNESTPRHALKTPPRKDWSSSLNNLRGTLVTLFNDFAVIPFGDAELRSPELLLNGYNSLRLTLTDIITSVDCLAQDVRAQHPDLAYLSPKFSMGTQTDDPIPSQPANEEPPAPPAPPPLPLPSTYASVAILHNSGQHRQAPPRYYPSTRKAKTPVKPLDPARIVVELKNYPTLPIRGLSAPDLFRRLTESCVKVPGAPIPLGIHWNRKDNLIISFPAGTARTAINTLFPTIHSLVGMEGKPVIRFDVPWRKLHLAGIRARDCPNLPIASEEELRQTLLLNPALKSLNITVQPTWLKKPESITGTHTSAIIAFEDPDGTIEWSLLKTAIFAFGEPITVKKWHDQPPVKSKA